MSFDLSDDSVFRGELREVLAQALETTESRAGCGYTGNGICTVEAASDEQ